MLVCAELVRERADEFIVPHTVVVEVCWLLERNFGPSVEAEFLRSVASGVPKIESLGSEDLVDASIVAVAERLEVTTIATLNRRDFAVVCPRHTNVFGLIP